MPFAEMTFDLDGQRGGEGERRGEGRGKQRGPEHRRFLAIGLNALAAAA